MRRLLSQYRTVSRTCVFLAVVAVLAVSVVMSIGAYAQGPSAADASNVPSGSMLGRVNRVHIWAKYEIAPLPPHTKHKLNVLFKNENDQTVGIHAVLDCNWRSWDRVCLDRSFEWKSNYRKVVVQFVTGTPGCVDDGLCKATFTFQRGRAAVSIVKK